MKKTKSYGASYEVAQHLTGLYQDYYEGERFNESGHLFWCIGINLDSTSRVMQKALFGTEDIRMDALIGTGSIPRDCIDMGSFSKDGKRLISARVKHVDGGYNTIQFFSAAQGQDQLMGSVVKFVWLDEESPHNSMEIYSQCLTRTTTTKGHVMITCTPEQGFTDLQRLFAEGDRDELHITSASWKDCPHIDPADYKRLLAGIPEYQHDMRMSGLPILGSGAVFPYADDVIMCDDLMPMPHWPTLVSLDFSSVNDASVVCFNTYDPNTDTYYVYDMNYITDVSSKNERFMASLILESPIPYVPVVSPHDGGIKSLNPESKAKVMMGLGVNIQADPFYNPPITRLGIHKITERNREREPGLTEMRRLIEEGKLKVCRKVTAFFTEKAQLFYAPVTGGGIKCVGKDDAIDAIRYGIMSLVGNRGTPYGLCGSNFNNGFDNPDEDRFSYD